MAAVLAVAAPAAAPTRFEVLRWTVPGAELAALTTQPAACLDNNSVNAGAGEALFNSPALLGGQAAKAGMSCASCHVNGRDNVHFVMAGVSGAPGTADVTNSFFSAARGNGRFDPVAIPDLALPGKVARDPAAGALEPFIRTLIVEEFSGREPTPAMLLALGTYVRAVRACPNDGARAPRTVDVQLLIIGSGLRGAIGMARRGDPVAARELLSAARHQLGLLAERFPAPRFADEQRDLLAASRALQALGDKASEREIFTKLIWAWHQSFEDGLAQRLRAKAPHSLYNPANLSFVAPQQNNR